MDNSGGRTAARDAGLIFVLAILFNGLVYPGSWLQPGLTGTFHLAFFAHAGFTLYDGQFDAFRRKTWLLLLAAWFLAEIWPFLGYSTFLGGLDYWVRTILVNLDAAGWRHLAAGLGYLFRAGPAVSIAILCADVTVMHWRGWRLNPLRRTAIVAVGAIIGGLAMGLASGAFAPQQAPPAPAADPLMPPPVIVPEWFRLTYFAILRAVPEKLAGLAVMFTAMLAPAVWPWMHAGALRTGRQGRLWALLCLMLAGTWLGLAYLGSRPPGAGMYAARGLLAYYLAFFFILPPVLQRFSRP